MKQTLHYKALLLFLLVLVHSSKLSARFLLSKQGNLPPLPTLLEIVCCFQKLKFCMFCRERGFEPERNHQRRDFCANGGEWIDNECKLQPFSELSRFRHKWTTAYISFFLVFFYMFSAANGVRGVSWWRRGMFQEKDNCRGSRWLYLHPASQALTLQLHKLN
jgi:hypothetical protein